MECSACWHRRTLAIQRRLARSRSISCRIAIKFMTTADIPFVAENTSCTEVQIDNSHPRGRTHFSPLRYTATTAPNPGSTREQRFECLADRLKTVGCDALWEVRVVRRCHFYCSMDVSFRVFFRFRVQTSDPTNGSGQLRRDCATLEPDRARGSRTGRRSGTHVGGCV